MSFRRIYFSLFSRPTQCFGTTDETLRVTFKSVPFVTFLISDSAMENNFLRKFPGPAGFLNLVSFNYS